MKNMFYGWFDRPDQEHPTHDVPYDAPCLFCGTAISSDDVRTHSLIDKNWPAWRRYFYRTHRVCADTWNELSMDEFIYGMIRRNGD
jgi:hypothetical protein